MARMTCGHAGESAVRKGPWTLEEDLILVSYISQHGEGSWDNLARSAGLNRNGKSCRLRWLNYLRPGVRRGSISAEEDIVIRELHSRWGNKWSKIAKHLPGRTDNEIKNYWRTRIHKKQHGGQAAARPCPHAEAASEATSATSQAGSSAAGEGYAETSFPYPELNWVADSLEMADLDALTAQFFSSEFGDSVFDVADNFFGTMPFSDIMY